MHSCFALYLYSRVDVLPAEYCRELALTPDTAPPLAPLEVQRILEHELGHAKQAFAAFDWVPEQSTLISQRHRAQLRTGDRVAVVVLRPAFHSLRNEGGAAFARFDELNELLGDMISYDVVADFEAALRRKTNFISVREGLELIERDALSFEQLQAHKSYPELSTATVLTFEPRDAQVLKSFVQQPNQDKRAIARRLCHVWLRQALHGRCFPVDPHLQNVFIGEDKQISFLDCELVSRAQGAKGNLSGYLDGVMTDDPDEAMMHLLREMTRTKTGGNVDIESLRSNFRQAAYFGMLEPVLGTDSNALAQIVFQHCKTAREHQYFPKPHLICFYRGLFSIARVAREICPEGDPLREGMDEVRSTGAFDQLREIMDLRYWFQNSDKFATAMIHLPRTFDEALTKVSTPSLDTASSESSGSIRSRKDSLATFLILLALAAVASQLPESNGWTAKIVPVALMLAGLQVLRSR